MGQVPPMGQVQSHDAVVDIAQSSEDLKIRRGTAERLHIDAPPQSICSYLQPTWIHGAGIYAINIWGYIDGIHVSIYNKRRKKKRHKRTPHPYIAYMDPMGHGDVR